MVLKKNGYALLNATNPPSKKYKMFFTVYNFRNTFAGLTFPNSMRSQRMERRAASTTASPPAATRSLTASLLEQKKETYFDLTARSGICIYAFIRKSQQGNLGI